MIHLKDAILFLKENCGFQIVPDTTWTDDDFRRFTELTGLLIPNQLAEVIKQYGQCGTEYNDSFLVEYEAGSHSVHDVRCWCRTSIILFRDTRPLSGARVAKSVHAANGILRVR